MFKIHLYTLVFQLNNDKTNKQLDCGYGQTNSTAYRFKRISAMNKQRKTTTTTKMNIRDKTNNKFPLVKADVIEFVVPEK